MNDLKRDLHMSNNSFDERAIKKFVKLKTTQNKPSFLFSYFNKTLVKRVSKQPKFGQIIKDLDNLESVSDGSDEDGIQ